MIFCRERVHALRVLLCLYKSSSCSHRKLRLGVAMTRSLILIAKESGGLLVLEAEGWRVSLSLRLITVLVFAASFSVACLT